MLSIASVFQFSSNVVALCVAAAAGCQAANRTFYKDVVTILQNRCQECHRPNGSAPMALVTYNETRPWAKAIRDSVRARKMPPWFADPCCGKFSNDRSLREDEIETLAKWAETGALRGMEQDAPAARTWPDGWRLPSTDAVLGMPQPFAVPAKGPVDYQYFVVPTGFQEDRWVQGVETLPAVAAVVHHAVIYIREPGSSWTHGATKSDILTVYAPGGGPERWPQGMAKLIKAGSDLVFEIHYTPNGKSVRDLTRVALVFAKERPAKRILTLQMGNDRFVIPPGDPDYRVTVWGTLPNDALLLGLFPHMHLRGKAFEFLRIRDDGQPETLLKVSHYDFYWQLDYRLAQPMPLKKGSKLEWVAEFDNSANNPRNPEPAGEVRYGQQSWEEMMIGFFDVAVDADVDKNRYFVR